MKKKNNLKQLKTILIGLVLAGLILYPFQQVIAQNDGDKNYDEIEKIQDQIEELYVNVYGIIELYPNASYSYVNKDGVVTEVLVKGIPLDSDKKQLEVYLVELEELKKEIHNVSNRVGIYYVTETEPKPKSGYEKFYDKLHNDLSYPTLAENQGVEGTIYVKFVLDAQGNIERAVASEDLETSNKWVIEDLKKEAKNAVKASSGDWEPAKVGGIPVSHWLVIPVQFKIDSHYFTPIF